VKKVYLRGPILTQSGYGHHTRTVLRALKTRPDLFDIYIQPIPWGMTSWLWKDDEERKEIDFLLQKTIEYISSNDSNELFDLSIQVTIPNEWEKLAPINIGVTAGIETTVIAPEWIEKSFLMDKIITISKHSMDTFVNTVYQATNNHSNETQEYKCAVPVEYVSYPVRKFEPKNIDLNLTTDFNFLTVAQLSPRKNVQQLFKCFVENFGDNENVGLIIKANTAKNSLIDKINTLNVFKQLISNYENRKCKIYLLHGFLDDEEMAGLYTHPKIHAFVSTTHGEGFGLPLFEAAYYGLPVLATDWSGHLDFLYKPIKQKNGKTKSKHMFERISYQLKPVEEEAVWKGIITKESMWAFPEEGSIKMALEEIYKDYGRFVKRAKELQKWICKEFVEEKKYKEFVSFLDDYFLDEDSDEFAFFNKENDD
jgi:glycosyltransferase involved in cell wall biosynthesis